MVYIVCARGCTKLTTLAKDVCIRFTSDINECASVPCQNNGTCLEDEPGSFMCVCEVGYNGTMCEIGRTHFFLTVFLQILALLNVKQTMVG